MAFRWCSCALMLSIRLFHWLKRYRKSRETANIGSNWATKCYTRRRLTMFAETTSKIMCMPVSTSSFTTCSWASSPPGTTASSASRSNWFRTSTSCTRRPQTPKTMNWFTYIETYIQFRPASKSRTSIQYWTISRFLKPFSISLRPISTTLYLLDRGKVNIGKLKKS